MRQVPLGPTGVDVSEFIFGAGAIGGIGSPAATRGRGLSDSEGIERLDEADALGINLIDTANSYAGGHSERVVGRWLETHDDVLVATKVGNPVEPGQEAIDLSAEHIRRQLRHSVQRLGRVDLYLNHAPDPAVPVEETLTAFAEAQQAGTIRAYGCSNVSVAELEALLAAADRLGLPRPGWVQNGFSLAARADEAWLLPLVRAEGLGYTPYSPLAGGVLSDRYLGGAGPQPGSRLDVAGPMYADVFTQETLARVDRLSAVAREHAMSTSGLALAWLRSHPAVTAPIVSPRTSDQWTAVTEALAFDLDDELAFRIGELFPVPAGG